MVPLRWNIDRKKLPKERLQIIIFVIASGNSQQNCFIVSFAKMVEIKIIHTVFQTFYINRLRSILFPSACLNWLEKR